MLERCSGQTHHGSAAEALAWTARTYRRAIWDDQLAYVEIWCEKDALAGVLYQVTESWDVPLMVTRGYPSLTYLASAAEAIEAESPRPAFLYYLGDFDPSGLDIPRHTEAQMRDLAPYTNFTFERVAVTAEQISQWNLPTRPTKLSDSRARTFAGSASVELDAIPPAELRTLVDRCISQHVDEATLRRTEAIERDARFLLSSLRLPFDTALGAISTRPDRPGI